MGRRRHAEGVPPARRALHVRRRETVARGVGPQARDVVDPARLQPGEQPGGGKAGVDADHRHLAQAGLRAVDHVEDDLERALGGADIAGAQAGVEHVAGFGHGGDEGRVDPAPIVAVPRGLRLVAVHIDGQAVDIGGQPAGPFAAALLRAGEVG
jgi:hypothetical protein